MVNISLQAEKINMYERPMLIGWSRLWLEAGFSGAYRNYTMLDGETCTVVINKGYLSLCYPESALGLYGKPMHIVLCVSQEVLERHFAKSDAKEIIDVFQSINKSNKY